MARVTGRTIVPTTEEERAVLHKLGLESLRVSRKYNPYSVARRLKRAAGPHPDVVFLQDMIAKTRVVRPPYPSPAPDHELPAEQLVELAAE